MTNPFRFDAQLRTAYKRNNGHSSENIVHILENKGHFSENNGHFLKNKGHFSENEGHFSENEGHFSENEGHFSEKLYVRKKDGCRLFVIIQLSPPEIGRKPTNFQAQTTK